jgi:hypothetical protein
MLLARLLAAGLLLLLVEATPLSPPSRRSDIESSSGGEIKPVGDGEGVVEVSRMRSSCTVTELTG